MGERKREEGENERKGGRGERKREREDVCIMLAMVEGYTDWYSLCNYFKFSIRLKFSKWKVGGYKLYCFPRNFLVLKKQESWPDQAQSWSPPKNVNPNKQAAASRREGTGQEIHGGEITGLPHPWAWVPTTNPLTATANSSRPGRKIMSGPRYNCGVTPLHHSWFHMRQETICLIWRMGFSPHPHLFIIKYISNQI